MSSVGDKISLSAFLADVDVTIVGDISDAVAALHSRLAYLRQALISEPQILAQLEKLEATASPDLVTASFSDRQAAARISRDLIEDLKERWIAADDPPLVDEIDRHFKELTSQLNRLQQPDRQKLQAIAAEINQLAAPGAALEGVERRYFPWAIGGLILFLIGIVLLFTPRLSAHVPALQLTILTCLGALPAIGAHYALTIRPRTRSDRRIDALNNEHFLPRGGIYFPAGEQPAGVILVDWTPPEPEAPQHLQDPRKKRDERDPNW